MSSDLFAHLRTPDERQLEAMSDLRNALSTPTSPKGLMK